MPDIILTNTASALGTYASEPTTIEATEINVTMVNELTIEKSADKPVWISGPLTFTITITNGASLSYETPTITDTIDILKVAFIEDSVTIGGSPSDQYTYDDESGKLDVNLTTITSGGSAIVTFQVQKK